MDNKDIMDIAIHQSALDYSISVNDLLKENYTIISPKDVSIMARNYLKQKPYCNFVYYGRGLVAIVDDEIKPYIERYLEKNKNELYRCFDAPQITSLNNELEKRNKCIAHLAQYFLPDTKAKVEINDHIVTKLFIGEEIEELYGHTNFTMALSYTTKAIRHDEIALAAYVDNKVIGVAGASNDSKTMWQIGVDVLCEYRRQGIASTLVYMLSQEILKRGMVPFYCCAWSNLASKNTARKAGFKDAWIELTAKSLDEEWIKKIR